MNADENQCAAVTTLDNVLASDLARSQAIGVMLDGAGVRAVGKRIKTLGTEPGHGAPPRLGERNDRILRKGVK